MPEIQILPENPGFGAQLGQALGGGVSQGISAGITQMMEQKKSKQALSALAPIAIESGVPPDTWAKIVESGALKPETALKGLRLLQEQKMLQQYSKSLGESSQSDQFGQEPELQEPKETMASAERVPRVPETPETQEVPGTPQYKTKPIYASRQIPPPVSASQIPQHAQARFQAQQLGYDRNKKLIETIDDEGKKSKELRPLIKRSYQLVKKGGVGGMSSYVESKLGESIPFFKSPSVAEFQRLQKEMTVGRFTKDFGARPSQSEFFFITDVYGTPGDSKEALLRKLVIEDYKAKISEKREEVKNQIIEKSPTGEVPINLNEMIEERLKPTYDTFLEATGYNKWIKQQNNKKDVTDDIMRQYLQKNNNNPDKALDAMQRDGYKVIE